MEHRKQLQENSSVQKPASLKIVQRHDLNLRRTDPSTRRTFALPVVLSLPKDQDDGWKNRKFGNSVNSVKISVGA